MGTLNTFHKLEKLTHKASIDAIFQKKGQSIFKPPILLAFLKTELHTPYPCQVFVSVGKRKFKKAVDRNRIKRQITDVYRLNKNRIYEVILDDSKYAIGILFLGKVLPPSSEIEKNVTLAINEFIKRIK
jgi:ribonuclease P protein component